MQITKTQLKQVIAEVVIQEKQKTIIRESIRQYNAGKLTEAELLEIFGGLRALGGAAKAAVGRGAQAVKGAATQAGQAVKSAGAAVAGAATQAGQAVKGAVAGAGQAVAELYKHGENVTTLQKQAAAMMAAQKALAALASDPKLEQQYQIKNTVASITTALQKIQQLVKDYQAGKGQQ